MATTEIDLDLTDNDSIMESFRYALATDSQLSFRFDEIEDDDYDGSFDPKMSPIEIAAQLKELEPKRLLGSCTADWSLTADGEDIEARNAGGRLVIHIREHSEFTADRSVVTFRGVAVSWRFPSELECGMDAIESFELSVDFRRGRCFVLKWPL